MLFLLALDWSVQERSLWKDLGLVFQVMVWWKLRASLLLLAAGVDVVVTLRFCAPLHLLPASFSAALVLLFYRFFNLSAFQRRRFWGSFLFRILWLLSNITFWVFSFSLSFSLLLATKVLAGCYGVPPPETTPSHSEK